MEWEVNSDADDDFFAGAFGVLVFEILVDGRENGEQVRLRHHAEGLDEEILIDLDREIRGGFGLVGI